MKSFKADEVKKFYGKFPFPRDQVTSHQSLNKHRWILNSIPKHLLPKPNSTIADVGCGTGEMSCFLSKYGFVTGFDFSPQSLAEAKSLAKRLKCKVKFIESDMTEEKNRGKFDYIFSIGVIHHIPDVNKSIENIKKMMNLNSLFIVSVYNKWSRTFQFRKRKKEDMENISRYMDEYHHPFEILMSRGQFKRFLERMGFKIVGEWRKMPDILRLITGKGGMMTFCVRLKR